ncbi:MAG TPA: M12 family metallopeptidase [Nakamurella sp.]
MTDNQNALVDAEMAASADVRSGYLSGPGFTDVPVKYSVVGDRAIYQGCIDMGGVAEVEQHAEQVRARAAGGDDSSDMIALGIGLPADSAFLWPNGVVPFVIDAGLPSQNRVTNAIAHLEANTGIRFVARAAQANYVRFVSNGDANFSSSPIGMRGGQQQIRISNGATMGTVVHECLHSLGVLHEQSRCDRDSFVKIHYENIQAGMESNFDKFCEGFDDYYEYDYGSIMHYPATAFGDGKVTIEVLKSGVTIGQRSGLSFGDRLTISNMYRRFFTSGYHGVWRGGTGGYGLWVNANWDAFRAKWQEWAGQGLRLVDLEIRRIGNEDRYSGVWLPGTGGYGLWVNASWDSFRAKWQEWAAQGLRLVDLHIRQSGNQTLYSGVWLPGTGGYGLWVNASWDSFRAKWQEWAGQGLRLVDVQMHQVGNSVTYSGVWLPGNQGYGLWANASWDGFVAKWKEWSGQGLRLVDMDVKQVGGSNRYTGVFLAGSDGYYLWGNATWENFRAKWEQLAAQGLRLIDFEFAVPATADADGLSAAGIPAELVDDTGDGAGSGGLFGFDGVPATSPMPADQAAAAPASDGNGFGGIVAAMPATAAYADADADAMDGDGGVVVVVLTEAPAARDAGGDAPGDGGAVLVGTATEPNGHAPGAGEASFD